MDDKALDDLVYANQHHANQPFGRNNANVITQLRSKRDQFRRDWHRAMDELAEMRAQIAQKDAEITRWKDAPMAEQLCRLMMALEIPPSAINLVPEQLGMIAAAVVKQAKSAEKAEREVEALKDALRRMMDHQGRHLPKHQEAIDAANRAGGEMKLAFLKRIVQDSPYQNTTSFAISPQEIMQMIACIEAGDVLRSDCFEHSFGVEQYDKARAELEK